MKIAIYVLLVILYIFLILFGFMWAVYHGSGHKIPIETDRYFGLSILVNVLLIFFLTIILKKTTIRE